MILVLYIVFYTGAWSIVLWTIYRPHWYTAPKCLQRANKIEHNVSSDRLKTHCATISANLLISLPATSGYGSADILLTTLMFKSHTRYDIIPPIAAL